MKRARQEKRVVVTGLGVASTLGCDVATFWKNVHDARPGYGPVCALEEIGAPFSVGGHLGDLSCLRDGAPSADRATRLALHAATQALQQAQLLDRAVSGQYTVGVVMGTTCGSNHAIELPGFDTHWFDGDPAACPHEAFENYDHAAMAHAVSQRFGFWGPSYVLGTACAAGNQAVGEAADLIRSGQADVVVCGGSEGFSLLPMFGFHAIRSLAERCQPFSRQRGGTVLNEGAAVLILEDEHVARARGAHILAELSGWALNCDATKFATPLESGERCKQLIHACVEDAGLQLADVDYIHAHGTGTQNNDLMEARGIALAYRGVPDKVPLSSIKGVLGHTMGASGAFGAVVATLAIQHGCIPPNAPISEMDDGVDLHIVTESQEMQLRHVLVLAFAFGGCNVATLLSQPGGGGQ